MLKNFFAGFDGLMIKISNKDIVDGVRGYRLMTTRMADAIICMQDYNRFSKGFFDWVGFRTK